ncbi:MAG: hypothetical protein IJ877_07520 [Candidatus Gastranaerophilales bacterium]|nr:hypothetical protein [Candidatus Gastranaerophilales bacterium]
MTLNVNTALYNLNGVDTASVAKVSGEILKNAQAKNNQPQVVGLDYSKFNRATLGVDLYSSRTNVELQKQISMIQAGLYAQAVNVSKLNSNAAMNLYSANTVQKQVEMTQSVAQTELTSPRQIDELDSSIKLFNIADKNSNSSNGFNPFAAAKDSQEGQAK